MGGVKVGGDLAARRDSSRTADRSASNNRITRKPRNPDEYDDPIDPLEFDEDPTAHEPRRVHADVFGHMAPADMPPIDPEAATRLVRTNHNQTYVGQYDHSAGVEKIFAADATESIFQRLKAELYALGYSSQGDALANDGWKVEDVSQRLRIAQSLVAW